MEIVTKEAGKALVAEVIGKVDTLSAADFEKGLAAALKGEAKILVLALGGLEYISSAGLRVILSGAKTIKSRGGELRLAAASGSVKKVLQISGFFTMFKSFDTVEAALGDT